MLKDKMFSNTKNILLPKSASSTATATLAELVENDAGNEQENDTMKFKFNLKKSKIIIFGHFLLLLTCV